MGENKMEEKQSIFNIKMVYKLNSEGVVPNLFHDIKRAKQQLINFSNSLKDKYASVKKQQEELLRAEEHEREEQENKLKLEKERQEKERRIAEKAAADAAAEEARKKANELKEAEEKAKLQKQQAVINVQSAKEEVINNAASENAMPVGDNKQQQPKNYLPRQNNFQNQQNNNQRSYENRPHQQGFNSNYNRTEQNQNRQQSFNDRPNNNTNFNNNYRNNFNNNGNNTNQNSNYNNNRPVGDSKNIQYEQRNAAFKPYTPKYQQSVNNQNQQRPFQNNRFGGQGVYQNRFQNNNYQNNNYQNNNYQSNNYQNNNYQNRGFQNNNFQNNNFRNNNGQNNFQNRPQRPFNKPFINNNTNKPLSNIIPRKTNDLASASVVFATKERDYSNKKKGGDRSYEEKKLNKKSLLRRGLIEEKSIEERMVTRKLKLKKPREEAQAAVYVPITHAIITTPNLTVKILSEKIGKPATDIIKQFMALGIMTTINSTIDFQAAELVSNELGIELELKLDKTAEEKLAENVVKDDEELLENRPPIVTVMGHVDHGKTSLLDYIRKTRVTSGEAGGITQQIGAYSIVWKKEAITFIDTPGHEAFANMRKRGADITDVAVLIVAGDDGVKPQTIEAIKFIKAAKVPMIVAVNKMDKQEFNIDRVKQQLTEHDVLPEEWGGDIVFVPVSATTGQGVDKLLEMIVLVAEMQNLKANKKRNAVGTIIEARLDKSMGPVANIIVQNGTLKIGDPIVSGFAFGKVRAMIDDKGKNVKIAGPSMPVSVLGFDNVPNAGDQIQAVDERLSKNVIEERKSKLAQEKAEKGLGISLDDFLAQNKDDEKKVQNIIIKADVQGSVEALKQSLSKVENDEVRVEIVNASVGEITENDVQLAKASGAIIFGFNIKSNSKSISFAKQNKVEIKNFNIIYEAIDDLEKIIKKLMAPKFREAVTGHAEVRALFKISKIGTIAGCMIIDGKVVRNGMLKVIRNKDTIYEGKIATLKREKDDVKEVASGFECGIKVDGFNDILEGDILECIIKEQINL